MKAKPILMFVMASLAACDSAEELTIARKPSEEKVAVIGKLAYAERIGLPENGKIEIQLNDLSRPGAPRRSLALGIIAIHDMKLPLRFRIEVGEEMIDPRRSYSVSAHVADASERMVFITDTLNSVTFDGTAEIDMGTLNLIKTH